MTDEPRPPIDPESPDAPVVPATEPLDPGREESSRPDVDEFDGGRGGVTPEFPGDERPAPDGVPETDVRPPPDDPDAAAVDGQVAGEPPATWHQPIENLARGAEREHLDAPNQGFRPGG